MAGGYHQEVGNHQGVVDLQVEEEGVVETVLPRVQPSLSRFPLHMSL